MKGGSLVQTDQCLWKRKRQKRYVCTKKRPCEDTERQWPFAIQKDRCQEDKSLLTPWSWISDFRNSKNIHICGINKPGCGVLLGYTGARGRGVWSSLGAAHRVFLPLLPPSWLSSSLARPHTGVRAASSPACLAQCSQRWLRKRGWATWHFIFRSTNPRSPVVP